MDIDEPQRDQSMRIAGDIVIAFLATSSIDPERLPTLVREVRAALQSGSEFEFNAKELPATQPIIKSGEPSEVARRMDVSASITPDFLISFEDGRPYRSLKRHLMAKYGMTPDDYRAKWGLPSDYPMVAPSFSRARAEVARRIGLGGRRGQSRE